jgi:hypothetical protein
MKNITDMIYFWGDGDERLDENNGDYVTTFLKQLAIKCLWLQCQNFVGANLVALFKNKSKCEGYCDMDGSYGIKILNYDVWGFSLDDLSIEVAATEA